VTTTTTASPSYTYRAQTDPTIKTWHLGAAERGAVSFCGVRLIEPGDTRAFALKVPADERHMTTDADVSKVTCGACKRNREYAKATAAPLAEAAGRGAGQAARPSRRRPAATGDPRADRADRAAAAAEPTGPKPRRRQSRADKAHAAQERDRERREAAATPDAGPVSGSTVIEADPETGLPRIKPEYAAKAERVAAAQIAAAQAARDAG